MLTRESVSIITVGKYNRVSTLRELMLDNSPCDRLWLSSVLEQGRWPARACMSKQQAVRCRRRQLGRQRRRR